MGILYILTATWVFHSPQTDFVGMVGEVGQDQLRGRGMAGKKLERYGF